MKKNKLYWLVESGLMIAVAIVLELISKQIIPGMPFGGQITFAAMVPVIVIGWKYGILKGLATGFTYALVEMALGAETISAAFLPTSDGYLGSTGKAVLMLVLDYILAFTVLGLGSMYKKVIKNNCVSLALGAFTVVLLRYLCHVVSGYILFGSFAEWFFTQDGFPDWGANLLNMYHGKVLSIVYSLVYNAMYMLPEAIFTTIVAFFVGNAPQILTTKESK